MFPWNAAVFVNVSYMTDNLVPEGYYSQSLGVCADQDGQSAHETLLVRRVLGVPARARGRQLAFYSPSRSPKSD